METMPGMHCIVLSKDKGFDPLLRTLNRSGLKCRRINSLLELDPKSASTEEPNYKRVFELLSKTDKKFRPRRRTTLSQHISAMFQKKIAQPDVDRMRLVKHLGLVSAPPQVRRTWVHTIDPTGRPPRRIKPEFLRHVFID